MDNEIRKRSSATDKIFNNITNQHSNHVEKTGSIIDRLSKKIFGNKELGSPNKTISKRIVNLLIESMVENLKTHKCLVIPNIGKLTIIQTKERVCRNPITGEKIIVPSKNKIKFSASSFIKNEINK